MAGRRAVRVSGGGTYRNTSLPPKTKNSNQLNPKAITLLATTTTAEKRRSSTGPQTRSRYRERRGMEMSDRRNWWSRGRKWVEKMARGRNGMV